jgi:hypothetical protein
MPVDREDFLDLAIRCTTDNELLTGLGHELQLHLHRQATMNSAQSFYS